MTINNDILLECVNYVSNYNFTKLESYVFFHDSILAKVASYRSDISYIGTKTVEVYKSEYILFDRLNKIKKLRTL